MIFHWILRWNIIFEITATTKLVLKSIRSIIIIRTENIDPPMKIPSAVITSLGSIAWTQFGSFGLHVWKKVFGCFCTFHDLPSMPWLLLYAYREASVFDQIVALQVNDVKITFDTANSLEMEMPNNLVCKALMHMLWHMDTLSIVISPARGDEKIQCLNVLPLLHSLLIYW